MVTLQLETKSGTQFEVTVGPNGDGYLHAQENHCDKVRLSAGELDNKDNIFFISYEIEEEIEELIEEAMGKIAAAWVQSPEVQAEVEKIKEIDAKISQLTTDCNREVRKLKAERNNIFSPLYAQAEETGGFDSLSGYRHGCCNSRRVRSIEIGRFELKEL